MRRRKKVTGLARGAEAVTGVEGDVRALTKDGEVILSMNTGTVRTKVGEAIPGIEEAARPLEEEGEATDLGLTDTAGDPEHVPGAQGTVAGPIALDLEEKSILLRLGRRRRIWSLMVSDGIPRTVSREK